MKGYMIFNKDWTWNYCQFEVGKTFKENIKPICGKQGFPFFESMEECFAYCTFSLGNKIAEVEALGEIDISRDGKKYCTNIMRVVRELDWLEAFSLVNTGKYSSELFNNGDRNSGSGNDGSYNSGYENTGFRNTGSRNHGLANTGYHNTGLRNSGHTNQGNYNSGNRNEGNGNSGYCNKGNYNSGNSNEGDWNIGAFNIGNYNIGTKNIGDRNIGDFNRCNDSVGCFNTRSNNSCFFNKPSNWTLKDWKDSEACNIIMNVWLLKRSLTDREKDIIKSIPNFDKELFEEITEIKLD